MEEDCRAVLRAPVRTLAVQSGWVVQFKKNIQQLHITYFCRVEIKFHYFGVPRTVCANVLVTGSVELPPSYPTAEAVTPGMAANAASTPQKHPAPNVAFSMFMSLRMRD